MAKSKEKNEETGHWHCCKRGAGKIMFGVFLLLVGLSWFGNDLGLWTVNIPWFPLALILLAVSLIMGGFWRHGEY